MNALILRLDVAGRPTGWMDRYQCAVLYCRDLIAWEAGVSTVTIRGGRAQRTGLQSVLHLNSIVATRSADQSFNLQQTPRLCNARLFERDGHRCLYCGAAYSRHLLTRDHVIPVSKGGADTWENVVTACRPCNQRKGNRLISDINMPLLAVPYAPNRAEALLLANRRVLPDQAAYLKPGTRSSRSRLSA